MRKTAAPLTKPVVPLEKKIFFPLPIGLNSAGFGADASI